MSVKCRLIQTNLSDAPPFEALSYVWGDPTIQKEIDCGWKRFRVTTNLHGALRRLRLQSRSRLVWADAICINQNDTDERNQQLRLMKDIYSLAKCVVVWLGDEHGATQDDAITALKHAYAKCAQHAQSVGRDLIELAHLHRGEELSAVEMESLEAEYRFALKLLFDYPWFERIWCVQEILAAQDAIVLYGTREIPWDMVRVTASCIYSHWMTHGINSLRSIQEVLAYKAFFMAYKRPSEENSLPALLEDYRDFAATDPRDKVYAIHGLARQDSGPEYMSLNYGKTTCEVYTDAATAIIQALKNLCVLSYVKRGPQFESDPEYPSWVPRWDMDTYSVVIGRDGKDFSWCANGLKKLTYFIITQKDVLAVHGVSFDSVASICPIMDENMVTLDHLRSTPSHSFLELWSECSKTQPNYPNVNVARLAMAKTLTAGHDFEGYSIHLTSQEQCIGYYSDFLAYFERLSHLAHEPRQTLVSPTAGDWKRFETTAFRFCNERRLFRTTQGYFGLGPACMREGDVVVAIFGMHVPAVLRRRGTEFYLMGEAYVDHIMNGSFIEEFEEGAVKEETFVIV